jgi:membrane-bound lytic murein transglycosylase D
MKGPWLISVLGILLALRAGSPCTAQTSSAIATDAATVARSGSYLTGEFDIPDTVAELMRKAQQRYLEGSDLLKSGESAKARAAFNAAVDLLLDSGVDLISTPVLNRYFQELIRKIETDESRYLGPSDTGEEKTEPAVVDELEKLDLIPIRVDPALKDVVAADLANTKYDIPVQLNESVMQSMNFWLTRGRRFFAEGLVRSGRYREMIQGIFRQESIPLDIMYLAQVESLFKTNALSRARAKGIWQFGRGTAIRYGLKVNGFVDERSDPEKSTRAAAQYLKDLFAMFKDWNLVLAAYNWGEGKIQKLIDRTGVGDFWSLVEQKRRIPRETKNHVPLIMASVIIARNPEKYGFPTQLEPAQAFDRVAVNKPIDLKSAAALIGIPLEELKLLNPSLRTNTTPPDYAGFELKVPPGSDPELPAKLAALPTAKVRPQIEYASRYKVQAGDTLGRIAGRFGVSVAALQEANSISSPKALKVGMWLRVPSRTSQTTRTRTASTLSRGKIATQPAKSTKLPSKSTHGRIAAPSGSARKPVPKAAAAPPSPPTAAPPKQSANRK